MTGAPRDTQARKKREAKKEKKSEREREGKARKKERKRKRREKGKGTGTGVPSYETSVGVHVSVASRNTPKKFKKNGEEGGKGKGKKGIKAPAGSNEPKQGFGRCDHLVALR